MKTSMQKWQKLLSVFLALIMVLGSFPATAFASEAGSEEIPNDSEEAQTINVWLVAKDSKGDVLESWPAQHDVEPDSDEDSTAFKLGDEYDVSGAVRQSVAGTYTLIGLDPDSPYQPQGTVDSLDNDIEVWYLYDIKAITPNRPDEEVVLKPFWDVNTYNSEETVELFPEFWKDYEKEANQKEIFADGSVLWGEYSYEPYIISIQTPSGGSYVWNGDSKVNSFVPQQADEGKVYVVTYGVKRHGYDAGGETVLKDGQPVVLVRSINIAQPVPGITERVRFKYVPIRNVSAEDADYESGKVEPVEFMPEDWEWTKSPFTEDSIFKEGCTYKPYVVSVSSPNGASYIYKPGDTSFTPKEQDKDKAYTVTYGVKRISNGTEEVIPDVTVEGKIIVTGDRKTIDHITDDEVRVTNVTVEVYDGTDPFDSVSYKLDNATNKGMDSSKTNGIVRTFDTIDYQLKFSTEVKNPAYTHIKRAICALRQICQSGMTSRRHLYLPP